MWLIPFCAVTSIVTKLSPVLRCWFPPISTAAQRLLDRTVTWTSVTDLSTEQLYSVIFGLKSGDKVVPLILRDAIVASDERPVLLTGTVSPLPILAVIFLSGALKSPMDLNVNLTSPDTSVASLNAAENKTTCSSE